MNILEMFLSSSDEFGKFYTSTFTKEISIFGVGTGRLTKKSSRQPVTIWLNEFEDAWTKGELPNPSFCVEELGLFETKELAQQAIDDLK